MEKSKQASQSFIQKYRNVLVITGIVLILLFLANSVMGSPSQQTVDLPGNADIIFMETQGVAISVIDIDQQNSRPQPIFEASGSQYLDAFTLIRRINLILATEEEFNRAYGDIVTIIPGTNTTTPLFECDGECGNYLVNPVNKSFVYIKQFNLLHDSLWYANFEDEPYQFQIAAEGSFALAWLDATRFMYYDSEENATLIYDVTDDSREVFIEETVYSFALSDDGNYYTLLIHHPIEPDLFQIREQGTNNLIAGTSFENFDWITILGWLPDNRLLYVQNIDSRTDSEGNCVENCIIQILQYDIESGSSSLLYETWGFLNRADLHSDNNRILITGSLLIGNDTDTVAYIYNIADDEFLPLEQVPRLASWLD